MESGVCGEAKEETFTPRDEKRPLAVAPGVRSKGRERAKAFLFLLLSSAFLLAGCSLTIGTNPDAYPFPSEEVFEVTPGTRVAIENDYVAEERVELASRVYCDLQHFTDTAVTMVKRELGNKGVLIDPNAEKRVVLKMTHPNWVRGTWSMIGRVTLQADLGSGESVAVDAEYKTAGNAMRAFNGAILRAVTALLKDPTLQAYLSS